MGTAQIVMPENYIAMFSAPQADEARQIVAQAEPSIDRAIAAIQRNQPFAPTRNNLYDRFMSGPVNPIFYKFFVKANAFTASDACIGCGQCAKRCPMNNVTLKDGKPVWGKNCTHCMACICYCPKARSSTAKRALASRGITLRRCERAMNRENNQRYSELLRYTTGFILGTGLHAAGVVFPSCRQPEMVRQVMEVPRTSWGLQERKALISSISSAIRS